MSLSDTTMVCVIHSMAKKSKQVQVSRLPGVNQMPDVLDGPASIYARAGECGRASLFKTITNDGRQ